MTHSSKPPNRVFSSRDSELGIGWLWDSSGHGKEEEACPAIPNLRCWIEIDKSRILNLIHVIGAHCRCQTGGNELSWVWGRRGEGRETRTCLGRWDDPLHCHLPWSPIQSTAAPCCGVLAALYSVRMSLPLQSKAETGANGDDACFWRHQRRRH